MCTGLLVALLLPVTLAVFWYLQRGGSSSAKVSSADGTLPLTSATPHATDDTDVVIVGGGVAGASLGAALGKRGYRVVVLEQSLEEPHRIVGELLQPSGVQILKDIGLPECLENYDAQPVLGYGIFQGSTMLKLDYPRDARTGAILEGRAFHNGRLIMALRGAVQKTRTAELRQGKVMELLEETPGGRVTGVAYRTKESSELRRITAPLTVVCDGLFSALNTTLTENVGQQRSSFLGLILRDAPYPLPAGAGHVFLADPTPILLYPISHNEGRMLVDFPPGTLPTNKEDVKKHLLTHTRMQLPESLRDAFTAAVEDGWSTMPNRQMGARPVARPGTLLIGDALNVRHPLTGGGMTVAFTDVQNILRVLDSGLRDWNDQRHVDGLVQQHYATRGAPVAAINILADALYDVFGQKYSSLRAACFSYLSQGGEQAEGPIRLLSGVSRSQALLVAHFFAVALWGCGRQLVASWGIPTPGCVKRSFLMLRDANIIILPLLLQEHPSCPFQALAAALRTIFWIPKKSYVNPRQKQQ